MISLGIRLVVEDSVKNATVTPKSSDGEELISTEYGRMYPSDIE